MSNCREVKLKRTSPHLEYYTGVCIGCKGKTLKVDLRDHSYKCSKKDCRYNKRDHLKGVCYTDEMNARGWMEVKYE